MHDACTIQPDHSSKVKDHLCRLFVVSVVPIAFGGARVVLSGVMRAFLLASMQQSRPKALFFSRGQRCLSLSGFKARLMVWGSGLRVMPSGKRSWCWFRSTGFRFAADSFSGSRPSVQFGSGLPVWGDGSSASDCGFGVGFTLQGCQLCGVLGVVPSSELSDFRQPNTVTPQEKLMRAIRIISRDC